MDYLILAALVLLSACGIVLAVFQLPGTWLIIASAVGYDWYYDWQRIGWVWLVALTALAVIAEAIELLAGAVAARKAGASRRAAIGALVGGLAGMIVISVPVPVIGTVVGGLIGCFVGALAAELTLRKDFSAGARVGFFATMGRLVGIVGKTSAALIIAGSAVSRAAWATW